MDVLYGSFVHTLVHKSGCRWNTINSHLWIPSPEQSAYRLPHRSSVGVSCNSKYLPPDSVVTVADDGEARVWDTSGGNVVATHCYITIKV